MAEQLVVAALRVVFLLYITLVLLHSSLERVYALRSRRQRRARPAAAEPDRWPAVDVVIPCFNEDPALLEACCRSVAGQDYPGRLRVWLVDDGSANRDSLLGTYERWSEQGWSVRLLDRNTGKRAAQDEAVRWRRGELVVLMDSDTVLAPDAVRHTAACFADNRVGAVSGSVGVLNAPANVLTRLIHHRYRLRFQVERPAQGFFTSLLCCSGPFAVYRRSLLAELWPRYLTQTFAGVRCTNGRRPAPDQPGPGHRPPGAVRAPGHRQHLGAPVAAAVPAPAAALEPQLLPGATLDVRRDPLPAP